MKNELNTNDSDLVVKNLLELFEEYYDDLPSKLQSALKKISESGINDIDDNYITERFPIIEKYESNIHNVASVNKILKKVVCVVNYNSIKTIYPEHFYLRINNELLVEW